MTLLAENLKKRLKELRMTQAEFAEKAGMSQVMAHKLLSGKSKSTAKIYSIAKVLRCSPEWLLEGIGSPDSLPTAHKAPLLSLKELQAYLVAGVDVSTGTFKAYYESNEAEFCIKYSELGRFELGELLLFFSKKKEPQSDKTVIYQITNKYGTHVVVGKYYEILGVPHLKNAHTLDGAIPDVELDSVDHQFVATMIEIRGDV